MWLLLAFKHGMEASCIFLVPIPKSQARKDTPQLVLLSHLGPGGPLLSLLGLGLLGGEPTVRAMAFTVVIGSLGAGGDQQLLDISLQGMGTG